MPVEALLPQGGGCIGLPSSGWSQVLRIDTAGGPPHCNFTNQGGGKTCRCSPSWQAATLADVILDLAGELGDKLGSLCQIDSPNGIGMEP